MTLVNRLIKEAKKKPEFLKINSGQVRTIAAHAHSINNMQKLPPIEELEKLILEGKLRMCGIPLKVE